MAVGSGGRNSDHPALRTAGDSVLERILDDGLQDQTRNLDLEQVGWNVRVHLQAVGKADFLDGEILVEQFEFLTKRDLLPAGILQYAAEKIAKTGDHIGRVVVSALADKRGNRIERIEQKMGLD